MTIGQLCSSNPSGTIKDMKLPENVVGIVEHYRHELDMFLTMQLTFNGRILHVIVTDADTFTDIWKLQFGSVVYERSIGENAAYIYSIDPSTEIACNWKDTQVIFRRSNYNLEAVRAALADMATKTINSEALPKPLLPEALPEALPEPLPETLPKPLPEPPITTIGTSREETIKALVQALQAYVAGNVV